MKPDIFAYLDYRAYLAEAFAAAKQKTPRLSYRSFAQKAGISPPNFLQMVIQGQRNLGLHHVLLLAKAFKLNAQEGEFFQQLVHYAQARGAEAKDAIYRKIVKNKRYAAVKTLDKNQYEFFRHWYVPVVRELLTHPECQGDAEWMAERIFPRITVAQVEGAKALLQELNLIAWDEAAGRWIPKDAVVSTTSETTHLALRSYHMSAIQLAHDSIKHFPASERDIRSVTLGLSAEAFAELKTRMEAIWKGLLDQAAASSASDGVYQVNMQLFPLTKKRKP